MKHDTKVVDTVQGPYTIFDWTQYMGFDGYCTGQDDVSMSLELYGTWEPDDWDRARTLDLEPGWVLDFGSHIGWYTMPLARQGHHVLCVDADPENMRLLELNARNFRVSPTTYLTWVDRMSSVLMPDVRFIKSDVEGAENEVVARCWNVIRRDRPVLLLECSPEFASYYPTLMQSLIDEGYTASTLPGDLETQTNVWFTA